MTLFPKTQITFPPLPNCEWTDQWYTLGSCFAGNLGQILLQKGLKAESNPAGNLYNPMSILEYLKWISSNSAIENELFHHQDYWKHPLLHSKWNRTEKQHNELEAFRKKQYHLFQKADNLVFTFGNASVWKKNNTVYANCHRLPQQEFQHEALELKALIQNWKDWHQQDLKQNPNRKYFLSLSPIRHFPGNLQKNSFNKAILRCFLEEFQSWKQCYYIPLYEIVHDELRDYQYYQQDGIHLREETIEFLLNRFLDSVSSPNLEQYFKERTKLDQFCNHKSSDSKHLKEATIKREAFALKWPS